MDLVIMKGQGDKAFCAGGDIIGNAPFLVIGWI